MSDVNDSIVAGSSQSAPSTVIHDPATVAQRRWLGFGLLGTALLIFYLLIASWPVVGDVTAELKPRSENPAQGYLAFSVFGWPSNYWHADLRMFLTVILAGALGSLVHTVTSFADYVGNRRLSSNWIWWFSLRIPIGVALALLFYLVLRGGLIVPSVPSGGPTGPLQGNTTLLLNPYGIAAISALAGMFSKQATDKLREVFETLFTPQKPVQRADPLTGATALKIEPAKLAINKAEDLTVTGRGFQKETKATINGKDRVFTLTSETVGKVTVLPDDVAKADKLKVVVKNPNGDTFEGIVEVAASAVSKPTISSTEPPLTKGASPVPSLTVKGSGFQDKCTATINGTARDIQAPVTNKEIKVKLTDEDVKDAGKLRLIVINSDGGTSEPREVEVK